VKVLKQELENGLGLLNGSPALQNERCNLTTLREQPPSDNMHLSQIGLQCDVCKRLELWVSVLAILNDGVVHIFVVLGEERAPLPCTV
jgi:hypothetical protein